MPASVDQLLPSPGEPTHSETEQAHLILCYANEAAQALLKAFDASRKARRATGGNTTDEEQDLLRAMLVFAGAGLDGALKRLIEDALPALARKDENVREALESFAARRLRDEATTAVASAKGYSLLAAALASESPQVAVVAAYVDELIGGSLQSVDRLAEAVSALGLKGKVAIDGQRLDRVFRARNRIVHEMDMDLTNPARRRVSRTRGDMISATNALLDVGAKLVAEVDQKLPPASE